MPRVDRGDMNLRETRRAATEAARESHWRQRSLAAAFASVLLAGVFGGLPTVSVGDHDVAAPTVSPASLSLTLYGTFAGGWSFTPAGETNPGPTITANAGDSLTVHIISEDVPAPAAPHGLFVDFNDDGRIGVGDYSSPTGSDVTFTFTVPSTPGSHYYYCSIHSGDYNGMYVPGAPMHGVFVVNGPPSASYASPGASTAWTAGSAHNIVFNLVDENPPTSSTLWVNYTYAGGAQGGAIAGPIAGTANPNVVPWTPPGFTATDVVINVTAVDQAGARGFSRSAPFEVDGTPPTIAGRSPAPNDVGVVRNSQVRVTWSEGMNTTATAAPGAFALRRVSDGAWMSGSPTWSPNRTLMTFAPSAILDPSTVFEVLVNGTAKDDSDPGNPFVGPSTWQFTTGTAVDGTPPVITNAAANPATAEAGTSVTIQADVTDDVQLVAVNARVQGPSTDVNLSMTLSAGTTWTAVRTYAAMGAYTFTVWAVDGSGNARSAAGSFSIRDLTAPVIASVAVVPTSTVPAGAVNITAQVTDSGTLSTVRAHVTTYGFDVNLTMTHGTGATWFVNRTYTTVGSYAFTVWATDAAGNAAGRGGSFSIAQGPPPPAPSGVLAHNQANRTIMVMWAPVTTGGVAGYHVYRATSAGGPFTKVTSSPIPTTGPLQYTDSNVQPGVTYYYAVTAVDGAGNESPLSAVVSAAVPGGTSPTDYGLWIALAVGAALVVLAGIVLWRRRKR